MSIKKNILQHKREPTKKERKREASNKGIYACLLLSLSLSLSLNLKHLTF